MDARTYNQHAWDRQVELKNRWTIPVSPEEIVAARRGEWTIVLTPTKPVPADWFPPLRGLPVLCLASGGGQQGPILAAAGADVTVLDQSSAQLAQDLLVADREGLTIRTIQGDMANLSMFPADSFGLVVHPCSNCFVSDVRPVWNEAFRVLRPGGVLIAGFTNPLLYIFDDEASERGELIARHAIPYSDFSSITEEERRRYTDKEEPMIFAHTLDDQIGGQLDAGFILTGFFEDRNPPHPLCTLIATSIATRAVKPGGQP